jgi:phage gpG-like protein
MGTVGDEYGKLLDELVGQRGGFKMGRTAITKEHEMVATGEFIQELVSAGLPTEGAMPLVGAGIIITMDKLDFAKMVGRVEAYKHIPYRKGDKAFKKVADYILKDERGPVQTYFRDEEGPTGKWAELSNTERAWRIEKGVDPEHPILQVTGELKRAVTNPETMVTVTKTGQYARMIISGEHLPSEGKLREKFFTHLLGSLNGWGKQIRIPARPFLPIKPSDLTADERKEVRREMLKGITEGRREDEIAMAALRARR